MELDADDSDTDMAPKTDSSRMVRTEAEKQAYAQRNRETRDRTLQELEDAWRLIESIPGPNARLLTINSFSPEVSRLLVKGRPFLDSARLLGCSQAAKQVRQLYRKAGLAFAAGRDAFFDALMAYNARVLQGPHDDTREEKEEKRGEDESDDKDGDTPMR